RLAIAGNVECHGAVLVLGRRRSYPRTSVPMTSERRAILARQTLPSPVRVWEGKSRRTWGEDRPRAPTGGAPAEERAPAGREAAGAAGWGNRGVDGRGQNISAAGDA